MSDASAPSSVASSGAPTDAPSPSSQDARTRAALAVALVVATCGLVYELLASTVASWVLGDTVGQFSTVIGSYLAAMGLGSYLSGRIEREVTTRFVEVELALALVGGLSVPALFAVFERPALFRGTLYGSVLLIGTLVGMEIPLLLRVLGERESFRGAVSRVLTFDHLGSLVGSVAFAFVLAPKAGALRAGLLIGALNALAALVSTWALAPVRRPALLRSIAALLLLALFALTLAAPSLERAVDRAEASTTPTTGATR